MNFGRLILCLLSAVFLAACERKPITVSLSSTNLTITATPAAFEPPPLPTRAQPKLRTLKIYLGAEELDAEVAITFDQQRVGMMYRTNLTDKDAMIFILPSTQRASFWMKNCPESLSAAYISPEGVIEEIHHFEQQDTNAVVAASENIRFVLEVKDGWFSRHNVNTNAIIKTEFGSLKQTFLQK